MAIAGLAWGTEELWAPEVPPFGLGTFLDELFCAGISYVWRL